MGHNFSSMYRKAVPVMFVMCGLLFSAFSFVYLYVFQRELLEALHYSLAHGKTQFAPAASAVVITIILLLLRWGVNALLKLRECVSSLSYVPSFLALCALTDVGRDVYTSSFYSCWTWLFPLLSAIFIVVAYLLKRVFHVWLNSKDDAMGIINGNLFIILTLCVVTVFCGNTDRTFHHELQIEHYLRNHDYDKALHVGEKSLEASRTLTVLRAMAMANAGTMGECLFDYPQYYRAEGLFFSNDSLETLRYTNDSIYMMLGAAPINGEDHVTFLRNLCEKEDVLEIMAIDYYLSALLLNKNLDEFAATVERSYEPEELPRFYREAMVLYGSIHDDYVTAVSDTAFVRRFKEYNDKKKEYTSSKEEENWMRRHYGNTYWWYYDYQK